MIFKYKNVGVSYLDQYLYKLQRPTECRQLSVFHSYVAHDRRSFMNEKLEEFSKFCDDANDVNIKNNSGRGVKHI